MAAIPPVLGHPGSCNLAGRWRKTRRTSWWPRNRWGRLVAVGSCVGGGVLRGVRGKEEKKKKKKERGRLGMGKGSTTSLGVIPSRGRRAGAVLACSGHAAACCRRKKTTQGFLHGQVLGDFLDITRKPLGKRTASFRNYFRALRIAHK